MNSIIKNLIKNKSLSFFIFNYKKHIHDLNDVIDEDGNSMLLLSAKYRKTDFISFLLHENSDINFTNNFQQSILHLLCIHMPEDDIFINDIIIKYPHLVSGKDVSGSIPLHYAVLQKNAELIKKLISFNKNTIHSLDNTLSSPLYWGCEYSDFKNVSLLLSNIKEESYLKIKNNGFDEHIFEILLNNKKINIKELYLLLVNNIHFIHLMSKNKSNLLLLFAKKGKLDDIHLFLEYNISPYEENEYNENAINFFQPKQIAYFLNWEKTTLLKGIHSNDLHNNQERL